MTALQYKNSLRSLLQVDIDGFPESTIGKDFEHMPKPIVSHQPVLKASWRRQKRHHNPSTGKRSQAAQKMAI